MFSKKKAYYLLIGFFYFITFSVSGQNQKLADSLFQIYKGDTLKGTAKLELLRSLSFNEVNNLELALKYAQELISLSERQGNDLYRYRGYLQKGNKHRLLGDLDKALAAFFKSAEAAKKADYLSGEGSAYMSIADIYSITDIHNNARLYYSKSITTLRQSKDSVLLAAAISNAGDEFLNQKNYDSALLYFKESANISEKMDYLIGKAYSLGNIGMVYANIGKNQLAEKNINEAIDLLVELEDYYPICVYLLSMADIYRKKGEERMAVDYATRSLKLAQQYGLKEQMGDASLKLSELYEKLGNPEASLKYYKNHITYRDSINNIKTVQKMADLRTNYEVSQKQIEVDLLHQQKRNQQIILSSLFIILGLTTLILGILFW